MTIEKWKCNLSLKIDFVYYTYQYSAQARNILSVIWLDTLMEKFENLIHYLSRFII